MTDSKQQPTSQSEALVEELARIIDPTAFQLSDELARTVGGGHILTGEPVPDDLRSKATEAATACIAKACEKALAILPILHRELADQRATIELEQEGLLAPIRASAREVGRREGIEEAARWVQDNWPHDKRTLVPAIRALAEKQP